MGKKTLDVMPDVTLRISTARGIPQGWTRPQAELAAAEIVELIKRHVEPSTRMAFDIETTYETDDRCEHCNSTWTEEDDAYNGGCCGLDEANNPTRLAELRAWADTITGADLFSVDDGRRSSVPVDWPWALAFAARKWLDADRPADGVAALLPLINRVRSVDWCTVWEDPGDYPSNAGSGPLPDKVSMDARPENLACDLLSLIDDMGLLPRAAPLTEARG